VDALRAADPGAPISAVGDVPEVPGCTHIPDQGDFVGNLLAGISAHASAECVLVSSADLPFLTGPVVAAFVRESLTLAATRRANIVYPIVPVSDCYARYPGIKRTAIKVREGEFTGGNMMLVSPAFLLQKKELLARTYAARKNPFRLAAMLGLGTVARLVISQVVAPNVLPLSLLEMRVGALLGGTAVALVSRSPEIATDVDRPSDFEALAATRTGPQGR